MSVFKLGVKDIMVVGALFVLSACSSEERVQKKSVKVNERAEAVSKVILPKKATVTSVRAPRVIARVINPKVLLKKTLNGVENLIGKADFVRREGSAVVLQYKKDWCILDIFFYGRDGQQESTYYEFRSKEKNGANISDCINKMVNE